MYRIIDTPWNTTAYIPQLKSGGVETVIRYYNLEDSSSLPQKQFQPDEASALAAAGLTMAVVFEQTGVGANAALFQAALIGLTNVVFTIIAMSLVDRIGRNPPWLPSFSENLCASTGGAPFDSRPFEGSSFFF